MTSPEVSPSSVLVSAKTKELLDSCHISDLLLVLEEEPSPLVNTIPRSSAAPVFPSPNLISLSDTVKLVALVVTTLPVTVKSPIKLVLPSTVRSLVTCWVPLTVKLPPVMSTLPDESMFILSEAAAPEPVKNDNFVALFVELKSPSDFATMDAPTILATVPVASSGAENSILPRTSLTWISVEAESNFNTEPSSDFEEILFTLDVPDTDKFPIVAVPVIPTSANPLTLLFESTTTALFDKTVPADTLWRVLISSADELIAFPPNVRLDVVNLPVKPTSLNPDTLLLASTTTTFSWATLPLVIPCNILISSAVDNISVPPSLIVPVVNLPVKPTLANPEIFLLTSTTTAFSLETVPPLTPLSLLISLEIAVISTPLISSVLARNSPVIVISLIPLILLVASNTTALWALAVPEVTLYNVLISVAVDLTRTPPNLRPAVEESCEAISTTSLPSLTPNLVTPVTLWVTAFPSEDCPRVKLSTTANEFSSSVVVPNIKLPATVKSSLISWEPLTVTSPLVTVTLPLESILILSLAREVPPVMNNSLVALLVELKSPSDLATIDALVILATAPVVSSGAWNSILPRISLTCMSLVEVCNLRTEPLRDFEVILFTFVVPETLKLAVVVTPVLVTFLNPVISLFSFTITTFPCETVPSVTSANLLICETGAFKSIPLTVKEPVVIFPVAVRSLKPLISFCWLTTTALPSATVPFVTLLRLLISSAVDNISVPPSLIVPVVNLPVKPTLANPVTLFWLSTITTFPSDTVPTLTPVNLSISLEIPVIFTPATLSVWEVNFPANVISFIAVTSLFTSNTTALEALAVPAETSYNVLISAAVDLTRTPPNLRPATVESWDTISIISGPPLVPIPITPVLLWVTTFPLRDWPGVIPSRTPNEAEFNVVEPRIIFPSTVRFDVICSLPFNVKSPPVTLILPEESITSLSEAAWVAPVIKESLVALLVLLKSPSDLATIDAATILDASPVDSSGDWNSILPRTSSTWISVEEDCNFNTEPLADLDVILSVIVEPVTSISVVFIFPVPVILLNPVTLLLISTVTTRSLTIVPAVTSFVKLIFPAEAVTSCPPILRVPVVNLPVKPISLNPDMFLSSSTITTLPLLTKPGVMLSNLFISSAIAVIFTPPISSVCALNSPVIVILRISAISLLLSNTTALFLLAAPAITPSRYPNSVAEKDLLPKVNVPSMLTSPANCASSDAVILPNLRSANPSAVTEPDVVPSSEFEDINAKLSVASCHIRDLFNVLVVMPSPRVNTIPKSWVAPILPSPSLIILSVTVKLVAWVVTTLPETVKSPTKFVSPLTVRLSPIVTWEVEWPKLIAAFSSCVPIFTAPDDLILALVPSKNIVISELLPKATFLLSDSLNESAFNCPAVSTTTSLVFALPVNFNISASNTPVVLWSLEKVVTPFNVLSSKLSPFSPLLSLTILITGVPSDALDALISNSGWSFSIRVFPLILTLFINVNPSRLLVVILPFVNVISANDELEPPFNSPLILIPPFVDISPLNVTFPPNVELPVTLISPSSNVFPPDTRNAFELVIVILFPSAGAPSIWTVDALVVVTLVKLAAKVPPLRE